MDRMPATQAVETLVQDYYKLVFHTIYGLTNDWEESQDLTQDTFQQALRSIDAARATSGEQFHAKAWLLRIALNTVRMQRRRMQLFRFIPFSRLQEGKAQESEHETLHQEAARVQPAGYGAVEAGDFAEVVVERDMVQRTMTQLPEALRTCLLLSVVGGLSSYEIAILLDLKEPAVRQRLARARKQFQQIYTQESGEEVFDGTRTDATLHETHVPHSGKGRAERQGLADRNSINKRQQLTLASHP